MYDIKGPMKNPKRFRIPLKSHALGYVAMERADTLAIPIPKSFAFRFYRDLDGIEYLGRRNGKDLYGVILSENVNRIAAARLDHLEIGSLVLVIRDLREHGVAFDFDGVQHWVMDAMYWGLYIDAHTLCGKQKYLPRDSVSTKKATCPDCLKANAAWFLCEIQHYSHPRAIEKLTSKLHAKARRRERYPTVYEHLLEDPLSDDYVPPPPLPRPDPPEREIIIPGTTGQREERRTSEKRRKTYAEEKAKSWRSRLKER